MSNVESDEAAYHPHNTAAPEFSRHLEELIYAFIAALATSALDQSLNPIKERIGGPLYSFIILCVAGTLWSMFSRFGHYLKILSGAERPQGSSERLEYDEFWTRRLQIGTPASLYADRLQKALDAVDHFFGDYGPPKQTLFTRLFALRRPGHIWTAPALDRCILLAYIYPVVAILFIWVISGQSGPAEYALGLPSGRAGLIRGLAAAATIVSSFSYFQSRRAAAQLRGPSRRSALLPFVAWFVIAAVSAFVVNLLLLPGGIGAVAGTVALSSSVIGAAAGDSFLAVGTAVAGGIIASFFVGSSYRVASIMSATAIAAIGVFWAAAGSKIPRRSVFILFIFLICAVTGSLIGAKVLSASVLWPLLGPLLLFFGLLSALNAPFSWFSLGVTRALLRRGAESDNWWPYFYALVDATVAVLVIMLLSFVLVLAIETFDLFAALGGGLGKSVLPLVAQASQNPQALFDGIAQDPSAPKYWWFYGMLLSAAIPSIANLVVGGLSLTRSMPLITNYARRLMSVPARANRNWVAFLLTAQDLVGVVAGVGVQALLVFLILGQILPLLGTNLFALDRWLAGLHLPALFLL